MTSLGMTSHRQVKRPPALKAWAAFILAATIPFAGCGYMVGGTYDTQIRTVHVPIFQIEGFRRGLEFELTEAVQKQIQSRTPFRLAKDPYADTRLTGKIIRFSKRALSESAYDDIREARFEMFVEVKWEDLRTGEILAQSHVPISPDSVYLINEASLAPEIGQSRATATSEVVDKMAREIVQLMEVPW